MIDHIEPKGLFIDSCKVPGQPHADGRRQLLIHPVRSAGLFNNDPSMGRRQMTREEFPALGLYHSWIHYGEDYPGVWTF